jgi:hypothetical protein
MKPEMIERLKKLALSEPFECSYTKDQWLEKFAELIVKECLLCCEQVISDPVPKSVDTFEQGGIHCMDEIKQHFGVEE